MKMERSGEMIEEEKRKKTGEMVRVGRVERSGGERSGDGEKRRWWWWWWSNNGWKVQKIRDSGKRI